MSPLYAHAISGVSSVDHCHLKPAEIYLYFVQENLCHCALVMPYIVFSLVNFKSPTISQNNVYVPRWPFRK